MSEANFVIMSEEIVLTSMFYCKLFSSLFYMTMHKVTKKVLMKR